MEQSATTSDETTNETAESDLTDDPAGGDDDSLGDSAGSDASTGTDTFDCEVPRIHDGDLMIDDDTDPEDIHCIRSIEGSLVVSNTTELTSLRWLRSLRTVRDSVWITNNVALVTLEDVGRLDRIGSSLYIADNKALVSLAGLDGLTSIGDDLSIANNEALVSLTGLQNLSSVGTLDYGGSLSVVDNAALASLTGLERLTSVEGGVTIRGNQVLENIRGLAGLQSLQHLSIEDNPSLTDLTSFRSQVSLSYIWSFSPTISISGNRSLTTLAGLNAVESVSSSNLNIRIVNNEELRDLEGIGAFADAADYAHEASSLQVADNPKLERLGNISSVALATVELENLPSLTSLDGLEVEEVSSLHLDRLDSLTSLEGLENVRTIRDLVIGACGSGNANLVNLAGLENLVQVSGLSILDNPALASIGALTNVVFDLAWLPQRLWVMRNGALPQADVEAFAAQLDPASLDISICGNMGGPPCDPDVVECHP